MTQADVDALESRIEEVDRSRSEAIGLVSSEVGRVDSEVNIIRSEVDLLGARVRRFPQPHNLASRKDLIDVYETMKLLAQSLGSSGSGTPLIGGGGSLGGGVEATEIEAPIGCYNDDVVLWTYDGLGC